MDETTESESAWAACKKNKEHKTFFSIRDFMSGQLFRSLSPTAQDWLEATVHLTVRIRVSHTSQDRPDDDRVSELRGSGFLRVGTGFIDYFITPQVNQPCPCLECGGTVVRKHWAFIVRTAQHVVYDTEEAKATLVDLFYDDETERSQQDGGVVTVPALDVVWASADRDVCFLQLVTHDKSLAERVSGLSRVWWSKCRLYHLPRARSTDPENRGLLHRILQLFSLYHLPRARSTDTENRGLLQRILQLFPLASSHYHHCVLIVSHPHGQPKKITVGRVVRGDVRNQDGERYMAYHAATCPGSSGALVFPLYRDRGGETVVSQRWVWGYVHSGTYYSRACTFGRRQVNYGNYYL